LLHRAVHVVDVGEPAGEPLGSGRRAEDDAVALEERARGRRRARGGRRLLLPARPAERPAALAPGGTHARASRRTGGAAARPLLARRPRDAPEGLERVVRDLAAPDEIPERLERVVGERPERARDLGEEERAAAVEQIAELSMELAARPLGRVAREE